MVSTSSVGDAFKKISKLSNDLISKKNKRAKKNLNKYCFDSKLRYAVLDGGMVHQLIDHDKKYTVLHADGYNAKYMGKSEIRSATRAQKFRKVNWRCALMYHQFKKVMDEFNIDINKCIIVEGCYRTNVHTLRRTMSPDVKGEFSKYPTDDNIRKLDDAARVVLRKLKMYAVNVIPNFDFVGGTEISVKKKPGYRYEECFVLPDKGSALPYAYELAKKRWEYVTNCNINELRHDKMYPGCYTIGARNKRDYTYEDDELATSRAVHMPEMHVELTSAPWTDLLTEKIIEVAKGPIYIGNSILEWERLKNDTCDSEFVLEGDYKRFDSTLYVRMITCALAIMRCLFPIDSEYVDKHFIAMYDSLVIKDYYVIRGDVFRIFHGLPSGVKSTSVLGSIINLISLVFNVGPNRAKNFRFIVGGDDFLVTCLNNRYKASVLIANFTKRCLKLGMRLKFLILKYFNAPKLEDCPVFYKYTIYKGVPVVPSEAFLERVFMPWNKNYNNDVKLLKFLNDVMPSLGTPMTHLLLYYIFLQRMYLVRTGAHVKLGMFVKQHEVLFSRMLLNKEKSKLFEYKNDGEDKKNVVDFLLSFAKNRQNKIKFDYSIF